MSLILFTWPYAVMGLMIGGWVTKYFIDRRNGTLLLAISYTAGAIGVFVFIGVSPDPFLAAGGLWFTWMAWKEWRDWWNGGPGDKLKKVMKECGDKTRRIMRAMTDRMTPSPIPQPQ